MGLYQKHIFSDPSGRRARITNTIGFVSLACLAIGLSGLVISLLESPSLPSFKSHQSVTITPVPAQSDGTATTGAVAYSSYRDRHERQLSVDAKRFAFIDAGETLSAEALRQHATEIDGVFANWLEIARDSGALRHTSLDEEHDIREWLKENAPEVKLYPLVDSRMKPFQLAASISNQDSRLKLLQALQSEALDDQVGGLIVSLPGLPESSLTSVAEFVSSLRSQLNRDHKTLIWKLPPLHRMTRGQFSIARLADYVLLSTHDAVNMQPPGPLASQGWFESEIDTAAREVGADKLIISIGSHGYDWSNGGVQDEISVQGAWNRLQLAGASLVFDPGHLNPHFDYEDSKGVRHNVWFLDGVTAFNQVRTALASQPAGIAIWRLGLEDQSIWSFAGRNGIPGQTALDGIKAPEPMVDLLGDGRGAAFSVADHRSVGLRDINFDAERGLILNESLVKIPTPHQVEAWGENKEKLVALTFDDGPDDRYTPQVLDVLRDKGVPAAFFVIGRNALRHPDLMRRMYAEGHDIGNHTFSHPNLAQRSKAEAEFELNATQRTLEAQLGIKTTLFRAPYNSEDLEVTRDGLKVLDTVSDLGYVSVRVTVDPYDWAGIGAGQIKDRVVEGIAATSDEKLVLLHDSGGARTETIAALPDIIDQLRKDGYRFVTVHELLGLPRNAVMPLSAADGFGSRLLSGFTEFGLLSLTRTQEAMPAVAIVASALGIMRLLAIIVLALRHRKLELARKNFTWRPPSLSVLVPAYNEQDVICKTIRSLLASRYRKFDIIVIDDGSADDTAEVVRQRYEKTNRVRVFKTRNGGKSSALNFGLRKTDADIVVALDADTVFAPNAIERLVRHFRDPAVGAVAGRAVVGNEVSMMARFQSLEYVSSQNLDRRAFEQCNAIGVVPGAIGAWRRQALIDAGGFPLDTLAEDADATIAMLRRGWKILYEPAAIAFTEAPETIRTFLKQRFRWMYGTLQVAFKHRHAVVSPQARGAGWITIPNILIFQFAFTLLAPIMDLLLVVALLTGAREYVLSGGTTIPDPLIEIAGYWIFFQAVDVALACIAVWLNGHRSAWRLVPLTLIQRFCYRQLLYAVAIRTLLAAARGHVVGWGKLLRTGNVLEGSALAPPAPV